MENLESKETGRSSNEKKISEVRTNEKAVENSKVMPKGVKEELSHKQRIVETK